MSIARTSACNSLSTKSAWWMVAVLFFAYLVSFLDRVMVSLLVEPIKASLSISDTQFALLQGLAFSILYSVLSGPLGWMADRVSRRKLIAAGASVWSIATVACGLSGSFVQLLIARIGVGAGEATLSPSAVSMIADAFPPTKRALPMSIYTAAANIGAGAALVFGAGLLSLVAQMPALSIPGRGPLVPWQMAFVLAGILTILVTALVLTIREPERSALVKSTHSASSGLLRHLIEHKSTFVPMLSAVVLYTSFTYSVVAWMPAMFVRTYGWTTVEVGYRFGTVFLVFGGLGGVLGAKIVNWLPSRSRTPELLVCTLGAAAFSPFMAIGVSQTEPIGILPWLAIAILLLTLPSGTLLVAVQSAVPANKRGSMAALYYVLIGLLGLTLGPVITAALSDHVFGTAGLRWSLALYALVAGPSSAILWWFSAKPHKQLTELLGKRAATVEHS